MHTAWDQIITGTFRCGLHECRGFDLKEVVRIKILVNDLAGAMPCNEAGLQDGAAQIQISVPEPQLFGSHLVGWRVDRYRDREGIGLAQNQQIVDADFDVSRRNLWVDGICRAVPNDAGYGDHKFIAQLLSPMVCVNVILRRKDDLRQAVAVAQIDKNDPPQITPRINPSFEDNARTDVVCSQSPTGVRSRALYFIVFGMRHWIKKKHLFAVQYTPSNPTSAYLEMEDSA